MEGRATSDIANRAAGGGRVPGFGINRQMARRLNLRRLTKRLVAERIDLLQVFETIDDQQFRAVGTCIAASADEALECPAPRVVPVNGAPEEQFKSREIVSPIALMRSGGDFMKRALLIVFALSSALLALMGSASARLGIAPMATSDDAVIQVRGHGGHGHHYGWHGGRGHHYGWYRGRGHHYGWRHHRHYY